LCGKLVKIRIFAIQGSLSLSLKRLGSPVVLRARLKNAGTMEVRSRSCKLLEIDDKIYITKWKIYFTICDSKPILDKGYREDGIVR
jgi:hypothetical protein